MDKKLDTLIRNIFKLYALERADRIKKSGQKATLTFAEEMQPLIPEIVRWVDRERNNRRAAELLAKAVRPRA